MTQDQTTTQPTSEAKPKKKKNVLVIVLIVLGVLVICAIVGIILLIPLATFGIQKTQQVARDTQRKVVMSDIQLQLADNYAVNATFPKTISNNDNQVIIDEQSYTLPQPFVKVTLVNNCEGFNQEETEIDKIWICYENNNDVIELGTRLESTPEGFKLSL